MNSIDILALSVSLFLLSPAIVVGLIMLGTVILFVLTMMLSIVMGLWDLGCKIFKSIKKSI